MAVRILNILALTIFLLTSCIVVKYESPVREDVAPEVKLSPRPEIKMSGQVISSESGDMIAFLPEGWFFVDVEREVPSDIFAFAVNPDYTLGAAFMKITSDDEMRSAVDREGLFGLARFCMLRHKNKTNDAIELFGKYSSLSLGELNFATFDMADNAGNITKSAVFVSSSGRYYQISLIPMTVMAKPIPSMAEIEKIFRSVLTTVQY